MQERLLSLPEEIKVPMSFYANNRQKLISQLKQSPNLKPNSICLFIGVPAIPIDDQDVDQNVMQDDMFFYLFGVEETDCYGLIEVDTGRSVLFCPKYQEAYKMWMVVREPDYYKKHYEVFDAHYIEEIEKLVQTINPSEILIYDGENSDSGLRPRAIEFEKYSFLKKFTINSTILYPILNEIRTIKDEIEIKILQHIVRITCDAHTRCMRNCKPGLKEYQLEALFKFHVQERCGSKHKPYDAICASGIYPATLHYIVNDQQIPENAFVLLDMGSKYQGYCSDVTVVFPSTGKFTVKQKQIYQAVLDANRAVMKTVKAGTKWDDMHLLAEKIILQHLVSIGIVNNYPLEELQEKRVGAVFFPHGLGHFLGARCHDVGGYNDGCPARSDKPGLCKLRTRRVLQAGNVITIEPGCYFIEFIIMNALANPDLSKYLNKEKIKDYMEIGGVRIEDDVVIQKDGCLLLSSNLPRTIGEIEAAMAGLDWTL